jgi:hypothetical protein
MPHLADRGTAGAHRPESPWTLLALGIPLLVFVLIGWLPLLSLIALAIAAWRTRAVLAEALVEIRDEIRELRWSVERFQGPRPG